MTISTYEIVTVERDGDGYVVLLFPAEDSPSFADGYSVQLAHFDTRVEADEFRTKLAAILSSYRGKL